MPPKDKMDVITIRGRRYNVIEQLSVASRGRYKVHHRAPAPRGTTYTAIVLPQSPEAEQLRISVSRVPRNQSSLPKLVDWETSRGQTTLLLSWCEGISLAAYYKRFKSKSKPSLSVWEAIRRTKSIAYGLTDLHSFAGVIHGDVKPHNLILPSDPGSLFLTDFGSGWPIERTATRKVGDGCNPLYSSPEVFLEIDAADARADQFSLAVVLFEMLTGKVPYDGYGGKAGHDGMKSVAALYKSPGRITKFEGVPKTIVHEIDDVVDTALRLNPQERFGKTREFAQALGSIWQSLQSKADHLSKHRSWSDIVWGWLTR